MYLLRAQSHQEKEATLNSFVHRLRSHRYRAFSRNDTFLRRNMVRARRHNGRVLGSWAAYVLL